MPRLVTPLLTVDVIIRLRDRDPAPLVLIERAHPPPGWALPGGFVDVGERVEAAAIREAREETCLDVRLVDLLGVYSDPDRDPRGHTVSIVYIADAEGEPRAADDARNIGLFLPEALPPLAFDHDLILADYRRYLETGARGPLPPH
ncbi:NUDIX hydrolase [Thiohalobacter sp.]|uniref:NUDIX hydrolase n=1 Tax=Thiohalobacter sp. TaxID=2025948 RepID=UPI00260FDD82|nr:NUDIX hydrolase [Thiohalobacter sp.]